MSGGNNTINGLAGNDLLQGEGGNDLLYGLAGDDLLDGGPDNDTLVGGTGADTLNGGSGRDLASYVGSATGVTVVLAAGLGLAGDAAGDVLIDIEDLRGSSQEDSLVGSDAANLLDGAEDADTLDGGAGADTLVGGDGADLMLGGEGDDLLFGDANADPFSADTMQGGAGLDTVSYAFSPPALTGVGASLLEGGFAGGALEDVYLGIENLTGTQWADTLVGDGGANRLAGLAGDDVLSGLNGDDTLTGDAGADSLQGGNGTDLLDGGLGADTMRGGAGNDTYIVSQVGDLTLEYRNSGFDLVRSAVNWTLAPHIEVLELLPGARIGTGNAFDNLIIGHAGENVLNGAAGADTLIGGGGPDSLRGGNGNDRLDGGTGNDRLDGGYGYDEIVSPFALEEVALQRLSASVLRLTTPTGQDTLVSIEGFELAGTLWKVAPSEIPIGAATPYDVRTTRIEGHAGSQLGHSVGAADLDGDGLRDLLLGAPGSGGGDGGAWVVWGQAGGFGATVPLTDGAVRFIGGDLSSGGRAGSWVGGFGDVDGDGFEDVGIGAPFLSDFLQDGTTISSDGVVSLLRGRSDSDFTSTDGSVRFISDGLSNTVLIGEEPNGNVGNVAVGAGDLNGDGLADIAVGGTAGPGYVSLVLGGTSRPTQIGLADGSVTRISTGLTGVEQGAALGGGGDINGDGFDDLVIGARGVNGGAGGAWLLLGKAEGWGSTLALGSAGFVTVNPLSPGDALGAPARDGGRGSVVIVFGRSSFPSPLDLVTAPGVTRFDALEPTDAAGTRVSRAGDVNGDGFDDLLVGGSNAAWVILGRASIGPGQTLEEVPGIIRLQGEGSGFGSAVSGVGDLDGDGLDDLLVGNPNADAGAGAAWVIYGDHWLGI